MSDSPQGTAPPPDAFDRALAEYDVQHGAAPPQPAAAPPTPRGPRRRRAAPRLLVTAGPLGVALAAFAGMGIAALV